MRLPSYPKYKPSGVEWIGEVPEHWDVKRGRFSMKVNPPSNRLRTLQSDAEVSFVPMESIGEYGGLQLEQTRAIADVGSGYTEFDDGDVIVAKITPCFENVKGALAKDLVNGAAFGTTELHILRASEKLERRFLFYFTISQIFRSVGEGSMYGAGGQKRVPPEFCKNIRMPLPPTDDQITIADFLDRETAKIDSLIAKKQALIDRLKEKRAALISRTVTRGLPPDAARAAGLDPRPRLKHSGIDWIGEVPRHWKVSKMRRVCRSIRDGTHNPPERAPGIHRLLSVRNVQDGKFLMLDDDRTMSQDDFVELQRSYTVEEGDIVLAIVGATTGKSAIVGKVEDVTVQRSLAILRPFKRAIFSSFLHSILQSPVVQTEIELTVFKYSAQPGIYLADIAQLPVVVPPIHEQAAICSYLDREVGKLDALLGRVEVAIARLREFRSALITAAVTGKVDVREAGA